MRRFALALSVLGLFVLADQANAQYRGGRGGSGISIGVGPGGVYGGYSSGGYGRGYYPGGYYGSGFNQGYYGSGYRGFNSGYYGGYPSYYGNGYSSNYGGYGYGGYGSGIGIGLGRGTSLWFSPTGYNYIPWSGRSTLYSPNTTVVVPQEYVVPRVIDTTTATASEWALKIDKVMDGPAKKADLREGDVIMGVGQTRTQTLAELQQALAAARGQVDIVFLNKESQKIEKVQVTPDNGRLGIEVHPVDVQ